MNENNVVKENKKVVFYTIAGIIALAIVALGLTYAYWILTRQQEGVNTVNTACLSVKIENERDEIDLPSAYPISDEDGLNLTPFKFTVINKCSKQAEYVLSMEMLDDTDLVSEFVGISINKETETPTPRTLDFYEKYDDTKIAGTKEGRKILSGTLQSNESINYELRLWLSGKVTPEDDANNKLFKSKIVIDSKIKSTSFDERRVCSEKPDSNECKLLQQQDEEKIQLAYDDTSDKNLRYVGAKPNNYVRFNDEIWRIIGLVKVPTESGQKVERIKIIRTNGISGQTDFGVYNWDNRVVNSNGSVALTGKWYGRADWTTGQLKDMLNGIYYNSGIGNCYKCKIGDNYMCGGGEIPDTCDFTGASSLPKGLNAVAQNMIDKDVVWNIAATFGLKNALKQYEAERSSTTLESYPSTWTKTNDNNYHNGVGLMYPSDYGYAVGGDVRSNCLSMALNYYNRNNCYQNDWLYSSNGA